MNKIKNYILATLVAGTSMMVGACSDDVQDRIPNDGGQRIVQTRLAEYIVDGSDATLAGENDVRDMKACLFEDGVLKKIYNDLNGENGIYNLNIDGKYGTLYVVANTDGLLDWNSIKEGELYETEWLKKTVQMNGDVADNYFTGSVVLEKLQSNVPVEVILKRGVARVDMTIEKENVRVSSMILKNVAKTAYLLPQQEIASPYGEKEDLTVTWNEPLGEDKFGVAYIYEQENADLAVEINVTVNGVERTLNAKLPEKIKRNAVYTLNLGGDGSNLNLTVKVYEWNFADDTVMNPDFEDKITIDANRTLLPDGAMIDATGDKLTMPYEQNEFILALDCNDQLEVAEVSDMPLEISLVDVTQGKNLFLVKKKLMAVGHEQINGTVYFKRKGLNNMYREDCIEMILEKNPDVLTGLMAFDRDTYTCDFNDYVDGELGVWKLAEGKKMKLEFDEGEDEWMALRAVDGQDNTYRVLGGWKPNDPKADGREQKVRIVISDSNTGNNVEEYTVVRRNYGLPVVNMNGTWWCKYNAIGNSKSFEDQILACNDPAEKAGLSVLDYLASCPNDDFVNLWGWAYQGGSGKGMKVYIENGTAKLSGYNTSETVHIPNLDAKALAPNGYRLPAMADYNKFFTTNMRVNYKNGEFYTINGVKTYVHSIERTGVTIGEDALPQLNCFKVYTDVCKEGVTFYGPGDQWSANDINHNQLLIGVVGNGWFVQNNLLKQAAGGVGDTRILRFIKIPVEYMYE